MSDTSNKIIDTQGETSPATLDKNSANITEGQNQQSTTYRLKASTGGPVKFYYNESKELRIRYSAKEVENLATRNRIKRMLED